MGGFSTHIDAEGILYLLLLMPYETPKHLGRFQAHSPFQSEESLGSRRGRPLDSYPEQLRDNLALNAYNSAIDVSGFAVPADDETDPDSDYGSYDPSIS